MIKDLLDHPLLQKQRPWWLPFLSLAITLYGILVLRWGLFPVVFIFWWEVILMVGAALVRLFFALDGGGFWNNIGHRIFLLLMAGALGIGMIMLAVAFSINAVDTKGSWEGFGNISIQTKLLTAGAVLGLWFHFFGNGRFRTANPYSEMMATFIHLLLILAFLQVFTMHLIPKYPQLEASRWIAVAVVAVKFGADMLFLKIGKKLESQTA